MKTQFRNYTSNDFIRIRDFIVNTYKKLGKPNNWLIDRWEFVYYFMEKIKVDEFKKWLDKIGIWEYGNGDIAAVACTDGDAFFLLDTFEPSEALMNEIFSYAEENLLFYKDGLSENSLAITEGMTSMEKFASERGYLRQDWCESISSICLNQHFDSVVPDGLSLKCGTEVDDQSKGLGHIMAFNYPEKTEAAEMTLQHYGNLKNAPDYRPELDLFITNPAGEVVSFCNIWFDSVNKIGVLEPVGTHRDYRFKGLGRAVIYNGLNRLKNLGAVKAYVGADKPFYRKIGFTLEMRLNKWKKSV